MTVPVLAGGAAILLLLVVRAYNGLVRARNFCNDSWADVETELRRRYDLIPNLVSVVKGYAAYERELFEEVSRLRETCAANWGSPKEQALTENQLTHALNGLMARVEAYPDLKASKSFLKLQKELSNTEDRIQAARRFYNGNVRDNNNRVQSFPTNILANLFRFSERQFFELEESMARSAPRVDI